jgi:hypothetical protein
MDSLTELLPVNDPIAISYLSHLTNLPLPTLLSEPNLLQTQSHHLTSSLTTLSHASYPSFLSLHRATTSLSSSLDSLSSSLDSLIRHSLPKFDERISSWKDDTDAVLHERKKAKVVLDQHDKIRDILDIPILIDTCVRNGYFAEALSLASHNASLSSSTSPAILHSITVEVQHSIAQMLVTLLSTLREPNRKLPALWKAVNFLRKMDVFDSEDLIAVAFLGGREECLKASLDGCGRDVQALILSTGAEGGMQLGEREREDVARYLRKYIDLWREGVHDIISQYTSIFLDTTPTPVLHTLISTYATHALSTHLLPPLKTLLPLVPSALSSLLTQLTYCATAFARVGMDFRGLLDGLFCEAVGKGVGRELKDAGAQWVARVRGAVMKGHGKTTVPMPPSRWLVSTTAAATSPTAVSPNPAESAETPHIPPPILASYPPLAEFTNKLLGTLNGLRLLAPIGVMGELSDVLDGVLGEGLEALLGYAKEIVNKRKDGGGEGDSQVEVEENVVRAAGTVYVGVFVPFMRRALMEGVYGVEVRVIDESKEWEEWLAK